MKRDINKFYDEVLYALFLFLITSVVGGLLESVYIWFLFGKFDIGGFMYGAWRPIYGFGCLLLYFITNNKKRNNFKIFFNSLIYCSLFEYLVSLVLEIIFNKTWWDYSNNFLNLNGRICLFNSIIWGFLGLIFVYYIEPFIKKLFDKINFKKMKNALNILTILFILDFMLSLFNNFN